MSADYKCKVGWRSLCGFSCEIGTEFLIGDELYPTPKSAIDNGPKPHSQLFKLDNSYGRMIVLEVYVGKEIDRLLKIEQL